MKPATPLPWDYANCENAIIPGTYIVDSEGDRIHRVPFSYEEDTLYIVHACNAYPELVAALKGAAHWVDDTEQLGEIDALLAKIGENK